MDTVVKAFIVSDGNGDGCVLWHQGSYLNTMTEDYGRHIGDLGLDDAPLGVSVFEGNVVLENEDWTYVGDFRDPTSEEWECLKTRKSPWPEPESLPKLEDTLGDPT